MASEFERPTIDFLILADRAEAVNGKLYMMGGGWDRLNVVDFGQPVSFSLAVGVLIPWNDANEQHPLNIAVEHEDGTKIAEFHAMVSVGRPPISVKGQTFRAMITAQGAWKLPVPGTYVVKATLPTDGKRAEFHALPVSGIATPPHP